MGESDSAKKIAGGVDSEIDLNVDGRTGTVDDAKNARARCCAIVCRMSFVVHPFPIDPAEPVRYPFL